MAQYRKQAHSVNDGFEKQQQDHDRSRQPDMRREFSGLGPLEGFSDLPIQKGMMCNCVRNKSILYVA